MAKRSLKRAQEQRITKRKKEEDAKLGGGSFAHLNDVEEDFIEESEVEDEVQNDNKWDDEEQDYELKPRSYNEDQSEKVEGLPIRNLDGTMQRVMRDKVSSKKLTKPEEEEEEKEDDSDKEEASDNEGQGNKEDEEEDEYKGLTPYQRLIKTKEDIAFLAEQLMENPEENINALSRLRRMASSKNIVTSKLALLSLVPVLKSIAPSYRIRALTETEKREKVTKEVARLRYFEENLVLNYKQYIDFLDSKSKMFKQNPKVSEDDAELGLLATNAACELCVSLRFFNYRDDLIKLVVRRAMRKPQSDEEFSTFEKCIKTLEELLKEDFAAGDISFAVTRILCKSLRARSYNVDESAVNVFLSLAILNDYDPNASEEEQEEKIKMKKKDRIHLTKKQKKQRKERKIIDEEMRKAEQAVTAEEREKFQAQILKMLLTLYLDILKVKPERLMAPVLEGLSKFGHMVNLDLLGDFLQVLREVAGDILSESINRTTLTSSQTRQVLLCIVTAFALISNMPSKKIHVDLSKFSDHLYSVLPLLSFDADIEFSHKTLRLLDPNRDVSDKTVKAAVNVSTKAELLLRSLDALFFNSKTANRIRANAFTKRLYLTLLHIPEKSSIAVLKFINKLMTRYPDIAGLYSTEDRIANGKYNAQVDEVERANPDVAVLWENVILENHYSPTVSMAAKSLIKKVK